MAFAYPDSVGVPPLNHGGLTTYSDSTREAGAAMLTRITRLRPCRESGFSRNRQPRSLFGRFLDLPRGRPVTRQAEGQTRVLFDAFGYGEFRCLRAVTLHCSGEGTAGGVGQG